MDGPGWMYRAGGGMVYGTISLSIGLPGTPTLNDTMILVFTHQGTGWGVVPAGWTLIDRQLAGVVRGEMYWRRATGAEPTPVVITGLATAAQGSIVIYAGGLTAGNIVDAQSAYTFTGTGVHNYDGDKRAASVTPSVEQTLLLCFLMSDTEEGFTRVGTAYKPEDVRDYSTRFLMERISGTYHASPMQLGLYEIIKVPPCATGDVWGDYPATFPTGKTSTGVFVALKPDTARIGTGTRYYLSSKFPVPRQIGAVAGEWDSGLALGPAGWMTHMITRLLSLSKTDAGPVIYTRNRFGRNAPGGVVNPVRDLLFCRWMSPPLTGQTIDGTFDLVLGARIDKQGLAGVAVNAVLKVHIYITVGQTPAVRATLLDRYVDATALTTVGTTHALASAQALTSAVCQAGDSVMVELGARMSFTGTMPVPTRPVTEWGVVDWQRGACDPAAGNVGGFEVAGLGAPDAVVGGFGVPVSQASYLSFSRALVHQAPAAPPANISSATALAIGALPFTTQIDTSSAPSPGRKVWFTWTADVTGRIFGHTFGTHFINEIGVLKGVGPDVSAAEELEIKSRYFIDGLSTIVIDAVEGTTYYFSIQVNTNVAPGFSGPAAGANLTFTLRRYIPPANDDVIFASNAWLVRYTKDGVQADVSGRFVGTRVLGLSIDYTRRPIRDVFTEVLIDTADRLLVAQYDERLVYLLPIEKFGLGRYNNGWIDYLSNPWYYNGSWVSADHPGELISSTTITPAGRMIVGHFGNGYTRLAGRTTGPTDEPTYLADAATLDTAALLLVDASHADNQPAWYDPPTTRDTQIPALDAGGINYVEIAQDGRTLFYTSSGWYVPIGGQTIKRWDIETGTQLPDFATVPAGPGPVPALKGLFPLPSTPTTPDGGCLVCNGAQVVRLDAAGTVVQTYDPPGAVLLADVEVDSEGATFWTIDEHLAILYKYDLLSGALLLTIPTGVGGDELTSLVVYRAESFPLVGTQGCQIVGFLDAGGGQGCPATLAPEAGGGQGCQAPSMN